MPPWEKYQKTESGPWDKYNSSGSGSLDVPRETVLGQESKPEIETGYAGFRRVAQSGIPFGDEASAFGTAIGDYIADTVQGIDPDFSKSYNKALESRRATVQDFVKRNPVTGTATQVLTAFGSAAPVRGAVATLAQSSPSIAARLSNYAKGIGAGAGWGGLYGFSAGEGGLENRLETGVTGAAVGGGVAAALPPLVGGMGKVWNLAKTAFGYADSNAAQKSILRAFERDGVSMPEAKRRLADWVRSGADEAMLFDLGGENVKRLARASAAVPGEATDRAIKALSSRQAGQPLRINDRINKTLNMKEFYDEGDKLITALRSNADDLYNQAYSKHSSIMTPKLKSLLNRPGMQKALKEARDLIGYEGGNLGPVDKELTDMARFATEIGKMEPVGRQGVAKGFSLKTWDRIKRGLDSLIEGQTNDLTGKLNTKGHSINSLKQELVRELDKATGGPSGLYAKARMRYKGDAEILQALRDGRQFLKHDPEVIARQFNEMTQGEKTAWFTGVARALKDKVDKVPDGADVTKRIFGNTAIQKKLRAAFGTEARYRQFENAMMREMQLYKNASFVSPRTGSQTAMRQEDIADLGSPPDIGMWMNILRGNYGQAAGQAAQKAFRTNQGITSEVADQMSGMFFNPQTTGRTLNDLSAAQLEMIRELIRQQSLNQGVMGQLGRETGMLSTR